jgi:hypothetical protein
MEEVGKSLKSFQPNVSSSPAVEITSYPIRRQSESEVLFSQKIKILRSVEKRIEESFCQQDDLEVKLLPNISAKKSPHSSIFKELLYSSFELNNTEKRRTQIFMLRECILEAKKHFNNIFNQVAHKKLEEMGKIEEKNDRISDIMPKLKLKESIFHPKLDPDETPDSIIIVNDDEVQAEKVTVFY